MTPPGPTLRKFTGIAVRLLLGIGILAFLCWQMPPHELRHVAAQSLNGWLWWIPGIGATFLGLCIGSARWHLILHAQHFALSHGRVFRIFFIGQFFNSFLLGACGGDLARAYYVAIEEPTRKTEAVLTVLVDRFIGLVIFILFGCIMIALRPELFLATRMTRLAAAGMVLMLLGTTAGLLLLFRRNLFERSRLFKKFEAHNRFGAFIHHGYNVLYFYREHPRVLLGATFYSLANIFFLTLAVYFFGLSLGIEASLMPYLTFFPAITVYTAVPVTPGGIGIREGLFAAMFAAAGVAAYRAIPLSMLVYFGGVACSLFGGVIFLFHTTGHPRNIRDTWRDIRQSGATT